MGAYCMEKKELQKLIYSKIDELPTLPAVLPKLMSLMEDEKSGAAQVADTISSDPALTSKILKVSNSAYYGFSQEISSLKNAVPLLGFNMVRSLALSIGVINSMPSHKSSPHFSREGLWVHGLAVATVMQKLSKKFGQESSNDQHFVVGLLHDIGKLVLDLFFSELFHQALEETNSQGNMALHKAESNVIGFDHGEVGGMLLTRWKFPEAITVPIAVHHQTDIQKNAFASDIAMLRIADTLPQELGLGGGGNALIPEIHEADLKALAMTEKDLDEMRSFLEDSKDGIFALFSAMA